MPDEDLLPVNPKVMELGMEAIIIVLDDELVKVLDRDLSVFVMQVIAVTRSDFGQVI